MLLLVRLVSRLVCCYMSTTCHKPSKQTIFRILLLLDLVCGDGVMGCVLVMEGMGTIFRLHANINNCPTTFSVNGKAKY